VTPVASTVERVDQRIIRVDRASKVAVLAKILRHKTIDRALVFTRTKRGADKVVRSLLKAGIPAEAMHGNKSQNQRDRVLAAFRSGEIRTLVATDIAARGIDIDGISHVVNFDLPDVPETYVHRIGRTARAGADGIAISLCDAEEVALVRDIEKLIRMPIPATDQRTKPRQAQPSATQGGEGRPSTRAPKLRRNEACHRQDAEPQPAGYQRQPGLASVAVMHRDGRSSRKLGRDPRADKAQTRSNDRVTTLRVLRG
jgi:ATP-dependent RNA helicase RhlE